MVCSNDQKCFCKAEILTSKMKKIILFALIFMLLWSLFISGCSSTGYSTSESTLPKTFEPECPKGLVNDTYPGNCNLYVDENNNGICDLSE